MPTGLEDIVDNIWSIYGYAYSSGYETGTNLRAAGTYLSAKDMVGAGTALTMAGNNMRDFANEMPTKYLVGNYYMADALYWINDNWVADGNGLTMAALLNVMLSADFDEFRTFIGIVDAYRVGLWNKPFNAEYYAALARGFVEWA